MTSKKLQIRTIRDLQGNVYDIFEIMYYNERLRLWQGKATFFSLEEILTFDKDIEIENLSEINKY